MLLNTGVSSKVSVIDWVTLVVKVVGLRLPESLRISTMQILASFMKAASKMINRQVLVIIYI